jgi:hypothetical protein
MPLPKSSLAVRFGKLDQKRAQKNAILGTVDQAINVRQRELGRFSKRYGYSVINRTTTSGSITDAVALGTNAGSAVLQTSSAIHVRDATNATWRHKGDHVVCMPGVRDFAWRTKGKEPTHVVTGTQRWEFVKLSSNSSSVGDGTIFYRVVDTATNIEVVPATSTGQNGAGQKAIVLGSYVWLFVWQPNLFRTLKFDPASPATAPVVATFKTMSASCTSFDVFIPAGNPTYAYTILAGTNADGATGDVFIDAVNMTTGASAGSAAHAMTTGGTLCSWIHGSGGGDVTSMWAVVKDGNDVKLLEIAPLTMAISSNTTIATLANCKGLTGYLTGSSKVIFTTEHGATDYENAFVTRYVRTGSTTSTVFARAAWCASVPFQVSGNWYVITGHDDINDGAVGDYPDDLQRSYQLRDANSTDVVVGNIRARALYGLGGDTWQTGVPNSGGPTSTAWDYGFHTQVSVSGTTATVMLNSHVGGQGSYDYGAYRQTFEFASLGSALGNVDDAETIFPGGWGRRLITESLLTDVVPMMFPTRITAAAAAAGSITAGVYGIAVVYKISDSRGNISRSAPALTSATTAGGNLTVDVTIPYLRHLGSNSGVDVEVYFTAINGSIYFLRDTFANVPTSDTVTKSYATLTVGEALYTGGGVLSNYPAPPFRASFNWNDRQWLLGTELESEAWHSKQFASGIAPEYAPPLKVTTYGGSGSLLAGGVISSDYAVLFKRDAVFAVTGAGPDDTGGGGSFQVRRINWDGGCTNHASVVTYPGGCLFQGLDGLIYRVTSGLAVDDPGADAQDYAGATVTRAINLPKYREVRFYLSTGTVLVLDYGNANENAPNGYWYLDDSDTFGAAVGAIVLNDLAQFVDSTGVVWVEAAGQYYDGSSTQILQKLDFNTIQPFDLGGEGRISAVQFVGEWISTHDLRVAVAVDGAAATNYDKSAISAAPEDVYVRPGGCGRVSALDITVEERGTGTGAGFHFDGLQIELQPRGRGKRVNSGQRI